MQTANKMKLFLASEAKHPDSLEKLREFVGGTFNDKRILYIPTAANGMSWGQWRDGGSIKIVPTLGAELDIVELENTPYELLAEKAEKADIIWMAGGMVGYLLYWVRRRKLDQLLPRMLERGVIYVGSSAGSMICSTTESIPEWDISDEEVGSSLLPGLGYIDFEIYPHFEDELLPEIQKRWQNGKLYMIKNGEAITVVDEKVEVLGEKRVIESSI